MIKVCFTISFIVLLIVNAKASADTLITKLINTIYKEIVDPKAKFYYLYEFGNVPDISKYDLFDLKSIAKSKEIPFNEFIKNAELDTSKIKWSNYNLINARVVSNPPFKYTKSYRIINYVPVKTPESVLQTYRDKGIIPVKKKRSYSAKRLKVEEAKAVELYENSIPIENKNFYHFTKPIFSDDKTFVLIGLNSSEHGCLYVFKRVGGEWIKILQYKCWIA